MTAFDLTLPFGLGLASSLHCAQMCGPIVFCVGQTGRPVAGQLAYNAGRISTYAALGALAGSLGNGVSRLAGVEQTAAIVAGALMIITGVLMSGLPRTGLVQLGAGRWQMPRIFTRTIGRLLVTRSLGRRLLLGALMGFLPCGLIYAALLNAAAAGSPLAGAFSMAWFGMGTTLVLLGAGLIAGAVRMRLSRWSGAAASAGVIAIGVFLVWRAVHAAMPGSCHAGL